MKQWCIFFLLALAVGTNGDGFCEEPKGNYPKSVCFNSNCTTAIKNHIKFEFHAAFKYLYMGALFGQYIVERPGMAKFFLESATEERSHAIQMMDYLNLRGIKYGRNYAFGNDLLWKLSNQQITKAELKTLSIASALQEALEMEIDVTKKINEIVEKCSDDFHAADVFTNPILEEQHTGMRKIQGAIQMMDELKRGHPNNEGLYFAEYIFDQKMLKGEV